MAAGQSPWSWKWRASSASAERRPSSQAVGVGTARLSSEIEIAPGRQHIEPPARRRAGGPAGTKRPSRPASRAAISRPPQALTAGRIRLSIEAMTAVLAGPGGAALPATMAAASASRRSTVSPAVRHGAASMRSRRAGRRPCPGFAQLGSRADRRRGRGPGRGRGEARRRRPLPGGAADAPAPPARSVSRRPSGLVPRMCRPSRIWISLRSHSQASRRASAESSAMTSQMAGIAVDAARLDKLGDAAAEQLLAPRVDAALPGHIRRPALRARRSGP